MDVIGIAVVGGAHRDHRLQLGRLQRGDLQRIEAAPGDAHHAHRAVAPGLLGDPLQHLAAVVLLPGQVLVLEHTFRLAGPAQIGAHAGIAVSREIGMRDRIPHGLEVPLAVGDKLENGRHRIPLGAFGQPDAGGEPDAVGQRDPHVLQLADAMRKRGDDLHVSGSLRNRKFISLTHLL